MFSPDMNAKCNLPSFMLENEQDARMCGKRRGKAASIVFTIFIAVMGVGSIFQFVKVHDTVKKDLADQKRKLAETSTSDVDKNRYLSEAIEAENKSPILIIIGILVATIIGIALVWIFTPKMFVKMAVQQFLIKDYERDAMKRSGLSTADAFRQQQKLFESREQADSRRDAAEITSNAYSRSMRNQTDTLRDAIRNRFY